MTETLNVLMIARKTLFESPGGDTVQITSTAKYLRLLSVRVDIKLSNEPIDYTEYDLIHFFNIIRPDDILPHISKTDKPFVVSTIYVDYQEYEKNNRKGILKIASKIFTGDQLEYLKALARFALNGDKINSRYYLLNGHRKSIKYITRKAAMLLPNSDSEYCRFSRDYNIEKKYKKIPNAIDTSIFGDGIEPNENFRNHVLCVGRIEGRKNQLNLIKALLDSELFLTVIGKPSPNHLAYYNECVELAAKSKNVKIIEHLTHKDLPAVYKAAKVHVLASWFETTGLSSLEAAIMECNIVVTKKGDTEEYFEDMAYYCEPDSIASIKSAVLQAYSEPFNAELKKTILEKDTWEETAKKTLEAYHIVLNKDA